ncbi:MAG: hypothetical protein JWP63_3460 [Candidatus Solibacter sp.]|nr:hypothetical protein [Candidatus Solibacter sp.]
MNSSADRKEATRKFKERKPIAGAFAVHCTATGRTWVGCTPNLDAARNHFSFAARLGSHPNSALQAECQAHGEQSFRFEILEKLDDDLLPLAVPDLLKAKKAHWVAHLVALPI